MLCQVEKALKALPPSSGQKQINTNKNDINVSQISSTNQKEVSTISTKNEIFQSFDKVLKNRDSTHNAEEIEAATHVLNNIEDHTKITRIGKEQIRISEVSDQPVTNGIQVESRDDHEVGNNSLFKKPNLSSSSTYTTESVTFCSESEQRESQNSPYNWVPPEKQTAVPKVNEDRMNNSQDDSNYHETFQTTSKPNSIHKSSWKSVGTPNVIEKMRKREIMLEKFQQQLVKVKTVSNLFKKRSQSGRIINIENCDEVSSINTAASINFNESSRYKIQTEDTNMNDAIETI